MGTEYSQAMTARQSRNLLTKEDQINLPVLSSYKTYLDQKYTTNSLLQSSLYQLTDNDIQEIQFYLKPQYNPAITQDCNITGESKQFFKEQQNSTQDIDQNIGITLPVGSCLYFQYPLDSTKTTGIIYGYTSEDSHPFDFYQYVLQGDDYQNLGCQINYYQYKNISNKSIMQSSQKLNYIIHPMITDSNKKNLTEEQYCQKYYPGIYDKWSTINITIYQDQIGQHYHYNSSAFDKLGYDLFVGEKLYDQNYWMDDAYNMSQYLTYKNHQMFIPMYSQDTGNYFISRPDTVQIKSDDGKKISINMPDSFVKNTQYDNSALQIIPYFDGYTWGGQYHQYMKLYQYDDNTKAYLSPQISYDGDNYWRRALRKDCYIELAQPKSDTTYFNHFDKSNSGWVWNSSQFEYIKYNKYKVNEQIGTPPTLNDGFKISENYFDTGNYIELTKGAITSDFDTKKKVGGNFEGSNFIESNNSEFWQYYIETHYHLYGWFEHNWKPFQYGIATGSQVVDINQFNKVSYVTFNNLKYQSYNSKYIYAKTDLDTDSKADFSSQQGYPYPREIKEYQYPEKQLTNWTLDMTHGHDYQYMRYTFITDTSRKFLYIYVIEDYIANMNKIDQDQYTLFHILCILYDNFLIINVIIIHSDSNESSWFLKRNRKEKQQPLFSLIKIKPTLISVHGNIGSGKSTLISSLKYPFILNEELLSKWQLYLPDYYSVLNKKEQEYSLREQIDMMEFQLITALTRTEQYSQIPKESTNTYIFERSISESLYVFFPCVQHYYQNAFIHKFVRQSYIYLSYYEPVFDENIFVKTSPELCYNRIILRNRFGETCSLNYLQQLDKQYKIFQNQSHEKEQPMKKEDLLQLLELLFNKDFIEITDKDKQFIDYYTQIITNIK